MCPYLIRIPPVCHPYSTRMSSVFHPYVIRIPPVCHPYSTRMSSVSHPSIFRSLHVAIFDGYGPNTDGKICRYDVIHDVFSNNTRVEVPPQSMSFFQSMKVVKLHMYIDLAQSHLSLLEEVQ